jgi:hypothetical protein
MKSKKRRNNFKTIVIIILVLILVIASILIVFSTQLFKKDNKQNNSNVEFKLPFEEKEYKDLVGYDFYTKEDGTVLIKANADYEMSNISSDGIIINVNEKVVKIAVYELVEGNTEPSNVLMLTEKGNLYRYDLGQTTLDNTKLYKYEFNMKIKAIKSEVLESISYYDISVVELENGEIRVVGPHNILLSPQNYSIGKKVAILSLQRDYIVIENTNKIRIGDASKDKYFSISTEKWINENADVTNYTYLKDDTGLLINAKDFETLNNDDITNIYIITAENKLIYLCVSYKSLTEDSKILEKYEIKLNKPVTGFVQNESIGTVTIKFEDGTYADIKNDNLIFGMLSKNNNFFTFSKQNLKSNIEYKILTDKSGVNYKIKDYQIIYDVSENGNVYIINVFMITEDNKMVTTRLSNNQQENYIDQMKVETIDSEKLIDKFDRQYSDSDGYTTKIVFKDGTKIDFNTFIEDYLSLG